MPRYETDPPQLPTNQEYYNFVWECHFANLARDTPPQWYVIGNANPMYNCVAWTMGVKTEYVEHPAGIYPLVEVDNFYAAFGFTRIAIPAGGNFLPYDVLSYGPTPDQVEHVAVYLNVPGVGLTWTSKMGQAQLITHDWMQLIPGDYGAFNPSYYTHNGTEPPLPALEGETPEQTVQRLMRKYGLDRL